MNYFVIHNSDGDTYISKLSKEKLEQALNENEFGYSPEFLQTPPDCNTNYWGDSWMIIKGKVIVPTQKEVAIVHEIE